MPKKKKHTGERAIIEGQSVRLGNRVFKKGQEDELYQQISADGVTRLQEGDNPVLTGDWSGAKGEYEEQSNQREDQRVANSPLAKTLRTVIGANASSGKNKPVVDEDENENDDEDENGDNDDEDEEINDDEVDLRNVAFPLRVDEENAAGGWYGFRDANDEAVLYGSGDEYKVQGKDAADAELKALNKQK